MATLDEIVNVQIQLNTTAVGRADFGTLLVIGKADEKNAAGSVITVNNTGMLKSVTDEQTKAAVTVALSQNPKPLKVKVGFVANPEAVTAADLQAILATDQQWYFLGLAANQQNQMVLAKAVEATDKMLFLTCNDLSFAKQCQTAGLYRTALVVGGVNVGIALAVRGGSYRAGSETFALKQLAGVEPATISAQQEQEYANANATVYSKYTDSIKLTKGGKVSGGEWIDVIRFRDWLVDTMRSDLVFMMINRGKLPYTDAGLEVIANTMIRSLEEGVTAGGIVDWAENTDGETVRGYSVDVPRSSDVAPNVKASRVASVGFTAQLAGAVHAITVSGNFQYDNI